MIDTRWIWMEEEKEYQLMSADAQSHGYLISEEQAGQVMWMNLLGWEVEGENKGTKPENSFVPYINLNQRLIILSENGSLFIFCKFY